jgi:hypothetical protein
VHGRGRHAGLAGDQPRAPAGPLARRQHPLLERCRGAPRTALRAARAIQRPPARAALVRAGRQPPPLPPMRGARRNRQAGCRLPLGHPQLDNQTNELAAASRSEPRVTVRHPGPPVWAVLVDSQNSQDGPGRLPSRSQPPWARQVGKRVEPDRWTFPARRRACPIEERETHPTGEFLAPPFSGVDRGAGKCHWLPRSPTQRR